MQIRPRRSVLYVPGTNARAIEKARSLPVDGVILDLEDSVAPEQKAAARQRVHEAVSARAFGHREVVVRINGLDTDGWLADVDMAHAARPDAILVPKVSHRSTLTALAGRLMDIGADHAIRVWAMLETPQAVLHADEIAALAHDVENRLACFVVGTNDLALSMRARLLPGRGPMLPWLAGFVAAARAHGVEILDGPYNALSDSAGLADECAQGRDMGFDGKTLIHPSQIEACNAAFSPSPEELAEARRVVAAFGLPENEGKGVIALEGRMVERLHADIARRIIFMAEAIAAQGG